MSKHRSTVLATLGAVGALALSAIMPAAATPAGQRGEPNHTLLPEQTE